MRCLQFVKFRSLLARTEKNQKRNTLCLKFVPRNNSCWVTISCSRSLGFMWSGFTITRWSKATRPPRHQKGDSAMYMSWKYVSAMNWHLLYLAAVRQKLQKLVSSINASKTSYLHCVYLFIVHPSYDSVPIYRLMNNSPLNIISWYLLYLTVCICQLVRIGWLILTPKFVSLLKTSFMS